MKELLASIGIEDLNSFSYEYEPIQLDWWDSEHKTCIEIDVYKSPDDIYELNSIFCLDATGIVERIHIFYACWAENQLKEEAFIAKDICEKLIDQHNFEFSEENQAYILNSYKDVTHAFGTICKLLSGQKPEHVFDLKHTAEDDEEIPYEAGDNLDHFIAMMYMNNTPYTAENVIDDIDLSIHLEGMIYFERLTNDLDMPPKYDFQKEYGVDDATLEMIKETIRNYKPKVK